MDKSSVSLEAVLHAHRTSILAIHAISLLVSFSVGADYYYYYNKLSTSGRLCLSLKLMDWPKRLYLIVWRKLSLQFELYVLILLTSIYVIVNFY